MILWIVSLRQYPKITRVCYDNSCRFMDFLKRSKQAISISKYSEFEAKIFFVFSQTNVDEQTSAGNEHSEWSTLENVCIRLVYLPYIYAAPLLLTGCYAAPVIIRFFPTPFPRRYKTPQGIASILRICLYLHA